MTDFGLFLSGEELSPPEIVRYAQAAETAGFDRVWVSDHYHPWQSSQGESPFVWAVLGAIASTTGLRMTTAVTCPTFRIHPAVLAQATATVTALAPGRFTFGVGSGEALNEHILGDAWPPVSVRLERLEEAIEVIRRLWTGETVTHQGRYFTVHNARIWSLPETPPPIFISGFGVESTELAARVGDGWITVQPDADGLRRYRKSGGAGRTQAGAKICWAPTEKEAAETAYRLWGFEGVGGQAAQDLPMWHTFEALTEAGSPEKTASAVACGPNAQRAAESIQAYVDAGFDEVYISQMGPDQEGGIRFLAEEVLPLLR
ncbi:TIGR03557 family F420-dependent LLM class oxidoreductase [Parafrankia elaeagni]|uniref:TIGR03557 family F420-dependent LLM class oxidoreductase n=1 Tax=Parafrankia elaeagni TaxID=222534 RepID=UPI0004757CBA|nr:TIGR03557 family F420-dependent LLM class oxidoreductase [Parafrankia elaeagni]